MSNPILFILRIHNLEICMVFINLFLSVHNKLRINSHHSHPSSDYEQLFRFCLYYLFITYPRPTDRWVRTLSLRLGVMASPSNMSGFHKSNQSTVLKNHTTTENSTRSDRRSRKLIVGVKLNLRYSVK